MMRFLSVDETLELHGLSIRDYGGDNGVRDRGLLESAVAQPQASFGGTFLHSDVWEMAASYLFHLVKNHPFVDGNKRTAFLSCMVFLELNGFEVSPTTEEIVKLVTTVIVGDLSVSDIASMLQKF